MFAIPIWIVFYEQRINTVQISLLVAIQYASQLLLELPTGAFADLIGRKWSTVAGYFVWAAAVVLILTSHGFFQLLVAVIVFGLGDALVSGALEALVYDSHKQDGLVDTFRHVRARNSFWYQIALNCCYDGGLFIWYLVWIAVCSMGGG